MNDEDFKKIERAWNAPGWMSYDELVYLSKVAEKSRSMAEIGSWRGRSARAIADNLPEGGFLFCVDTWADDSYGAVFPGDAPDLCQHPDWLWNEFARNVGDHLSSKVFRMRMPSVEAAAALNGQGRKFDAIFIDAGHRYQDVIADIQAWRPLLADGGVLCGHDYVHYHADVIKAVGELVPRFRVVDTIWTTEGA